ncbi:hypothetical protein N431DRAFT_427088 [Stipitochalara longipes BDJ]|nr:hypothetical protein N431DRAFT_427088 [Stipitochalara longipes BDJ]
MKLWVTLLQFWVLATLAATSPVATTSAPISNLTFQEKHGCPSQGCPHNSARSLLGSGGLEVVYGVIIVSFAALL